MVEWIKDRLSVLFFLFIGAIIAISFVVGVLLISQEAKGVTISNGLIVSTAVNTDLLEKIKISESPRSYYFIDTKNNICFFVIEGWNNHSVSSINPIDCENLKTKYFKEIK